MTLQPSDHVRRLALLAVIIVAALVAAVVGVVSAVAPSRVADNARTSIAARLTTSPEPVAAAATALADQSSVLASESPWMSAFGALETGSGSLGAAQAAAKRVAQDAEAAQRQVSGLDPAPWQGGGLTGLESALGGVASAADNAAGASSPAAYDSDAEALMAAFDTLASASERAVAGAGGP